MKRILAIVLAAMLALSMLGAMAETANPVAGKKVSYVHMQNRPDVWTAAGTTDWTLNDEK